MRLETTFKTSVCPVNYHYMIMSLIKDAFTLSAPERIEDLYVYKGKQNKKSKPFTFAVLLNNFKKENQEFLVDGHVKLIISSPNAEWLLYLYNGLLQKRQFEYKKYNLTLEHIRVLPESLPTSTKCLFQTLSPIVLKNKQGDFLSPDHPEFYPTLQYICNQTLENATGNGLYKDIILTPLSMKKRVVQQQHEHFKHLNRESTLYIDGYVGSFMLEGHVEDLRRLTQTGIGFRRSQGFGCVKLIQG